MSFCFISAACPHPFGGIELLDFDSAGRETGRVRTDFIRRRNPGPILPPRSRGNKESKTVECGGSTPTYQQRAGTARVGLKSGDNQARRRGRGCRGAEAGKAFQERRKEREKNERRSDWGSRRTKNKRQHREGDGKESFACSALSIRTSFSSTYMHTTEAEVLPTTMGRTGGKTRHLSILDLDNFCRKPDRGFPVWS